jgi:membrane protein DedA with SNARE-associated domain
MEALITWIVNTVGGLGYLGIVALMALESSVFPLPSEVVIPPAGYLVFKGQMNIWLVLGAGTLGSLLGAIFNYIVAYYLGRPLFVRYEKFFLLTPEKFAKIENFFNHHGEISIFVGRLIIVVRHYISLPAGLAKMNFVKFSLYTALGAFIWVVILACIGYQVGNNMALVKEYSRYVSIGLIIFITIITAAYYCIMKWNKTRCS